MGSRTVLADQDLRLGGLRSRVSTMVVTSLAWGTAKAIIGVCRWQFGSFSAATATNRVGDAAGIGRR